MGQKQIKQQLKSTKKSVTECGNKTELEHETRFVQHNVMQVDSMQMSRNHKDWHRLREQFWRKKHL